ncbi:hypothetical protein N9850_04260 [Granulosicoccus sp.]|nr:hypothetical protein [Granulosicoccus sp.]MDB4222963.1 hypothetical protein [Granulosicoccus sp.]
MKSPVIAHQDTDNIVRVSSEPELQRAMKSPSEYSVILIAPGEYKLTKTLWVRTNNVTIRGDSDRCDDVVLVGKGMENAAGLDSVPHGVWTKAINTRVQNLTIRDVYYHAVSIDGKAYAPEIYNVRMIDIGAQFVKSNPRSFGVGADNGSVQYSIMQYSTKPPETDHGGGSGYTQGVDVHAGKNWLVSDNLFDNFHTPDSAKNLWNPAILMWNGAANSIVQNNLFINVDRAIAFGLIDRPDDHRGGIIRNNMIVMRPNLYSSSRKASSDAAILVWNSPDTWVLHNTIFTRGNTHKSIELRFESSGSIVRNNLVDAPITDRSQSTFEKEGNVEYHGPNIFSDISSANLRLQGAVAGITGVVPILLGAGKDIDGDIRGCTSGFTDVGAHEFGSDNNKC